MIAQFVVANIPTDQLVLRVVNDAPDECGTISTAIRIQDLPLNWRWTVGLNRLFRSVVLKMFWQVNSVHLSLGAAQNLSRYPLAFTNIRSIYLNLEMRRWDSWGYPIPGKHLQPIIRSLCLSSSLETIHVALPFYRFATLGALVSKNSCFKKHAKMLQVAPFLGDLTAYAYHGDWVGIGLLQFNLSATSSKENIKLRPDGHPVYLPPNVRNTISHSHDIDSCPASLCRVFHTLYEGWRTPGGFDKLLWHYKPNEAHGVSEVFREGCRMIKVDISDLRNFPGTKSARTLRCLDPKPSLFLTG